MRIGIIGGGVIARLVLEHIRGGALGEVQVVAIAGRSEPSKVVGLVDAPGRRFVFSLYEAGEIWMADFSHPGAPVVTALGRAGDQPYDGLITGDGRHYIAGLFGEDGLAHVDLWAEPPVVRRILDHYGKGEEKLPVYKMPHLEGWALAGRDAALAPR